MSHTLIVHGPALGPAETAHLRQQFPLAHLEQPVAHVARLSPAAPLASVRHQIHDWCQAHALDHAWLPQGARLSDYRVLAMDMDSTLITIECIDEIADMVGVKPQVAAITEAAMRGEIVDFADSLRRRVALLAGVPERALHAVYDQRLQLNPGAEALLAAAREAGLKTLLVSGGFTFFTERLKARLNLDEAHANTLEVIDGKLTGRVLGDIVDASAKAQHLQHLCDRLGADPGRQAIALGDGANDLKMLGLAAVNVAYHAKPAVRAATAQAIDFGGLDGILHWFDDTAARTS